MKEETGIETETGIEIETGIVIETGIETETGGIKTGRKAGETKTGGIGTGNGIGQEVVLPKGILPVPANRLVVVTVTNTKRVNETKGREVKIRTETISKKR
mgnify:CR=1 FL=1